MQRLCKNNTGQAIQAYEWLHHTVAKQCKMHYQFVSVVHVKNSWCRMGLMLTQTLTLKPDHNTNIT